MILDATRIIERRIAAARLKEEPPDFLLEIPVPRLGIFDFQHTTAMIDAGQIRCGMVVSGENGRPLVEKTINHLLTAPLDRNAIKPFFANLTIGSAAVAAVVCQVRREALGV